MKPCEQNWHLELYLSSLDPEVLVHFSQIMGDGLKTLAEGDRVSFDVTEDQKVPQLSNVVKL